MSVFFSSLSLSFFLYRSLNNSFASCYHRAWFTFMLQPTNKSSHSYRYNVASTFPIQSSQFFAFVRQVHLMACVLALPILIRAQVPGVFSSSNNVCALSRDFSLFFKKLKLTISLFDIINNCLASSDRVALSTRVLNKIWKKKKSAKVCNKCESIKKWRECVNDNRFSANGSHYLYAFMGLERRRKKFESIGTRLNSI